MQGGGLQQGEKSSSGWGGRGCKEVLGVQDGRMVWCSRVLGSTRLQEVVRGAWRCIGLAARFLGMSTIWL